MKSRALLDRAPDRRRGARRRRARRRRQTPPGPRPQYLPFAEFATDDSAAQVSVKQAYNEAVERYNKALYDYHVTLGQHDQLVERRQPRGPPPERRRRGQMPRRSGKARDPAP